MRRTFLRPGYPSVTGDSWSEHMLRLLMAYDSSQNCLGVSVSLFHDASHGAVFRAARLNRWLMRILAVPVGIDATNWRIRHTQYHHSYANIEHLDLDIEANFALRQSPFQPWRSHYRYQHLYWPTVAALSLPYLNWYADWCDRFGKTALTNDAELAGWRAPTVFLVSKLLHVSFVLLLPLWCWQDVGIGWSMVLGWYLLGQMSASCVLVLLILGTHWADRDFFLPPDDAVLSHSWHAHQFRTTCDWTPWPSWVSALLGGLNYHLTHHLYPSYSHRHYADLSREVALFAQRRGIAYRRLGYCELARLQLLFLRRMGQPSTPHYRSHAQYLHDRDRWHGKE